MVLPSLFRAIVEGDRQQAIALTTQAVEEAIDPAAIMNDCLVPAIQEVGRLFLADEYFLPEMMISGDAMNAALAVLRPFIARGDITPRGKVVLGTVEGDLHDLGKNIVKMMLEGGGFQVIDAGIDVPAARFVALARDEKPDVIGMSALLTTTVTAMRDVINSLKEAGLRDQVKVIIGGGPVTSQYAQAIGADGYARDAPEALPLVNRLVGMNSGQQRGDR